MSQKITVIRSLLAHETGAVHANGIQQKTGHEEMPSGRNLTFRMVEKIGGDIVTGVYETKPFPTEAILAKQCGTSRSITREAVKILTAKGLVSSRARTGTTVEPAGNWNLLDPDVLRWSLEREFSLELLRHFSELRIAIEPEAAALAARLADEQDIEQISAALTRMERAAKGVDDVLDADISFHVSVLKSSKNPFYLQLRAAVETALRTSIRLTNSVKGRAASIPEHQKIRDCIASRDEDGARVAMHALISEVLELIDQTEKSGPHKLL